MKKQLDPKERVSRMGIFGSQLFYGFINVLDKNISCIVIQLENDTVLES